MRIMAKDRAAVAYLRKMKLDEQGRKAMELIRRVCMADEVAYRGGNESDTVFRCGHQQVWKNIEVLIEKEIDFEAIEKAEKEQNKEVQSGL